MFNQIQLMGELLDTAVVNLILELRNLKQAHKIGTSQIVADNSYYDARLVYRALEDLEITARDNQLEIKANNVHSAESSIEEILGNTESKFVKIKTELGCWKIFEQIYNMEA
jgi:hypothetical protein